MKTPYRIAKELGISHTAVKRKMTSEFLNDYEQHIVKRDEKVMELDEIAESALIAKFIKPVVQSVVQHNEQSCVHQIDDKTLKILNETIEILKAQLQEKDCQIHEKDEQIKVKDMQIQAKDDQIKTLMDTIKLHAESINTDSKNELAETIIESKTLIDSGNDQKNIEGQNNKSGSMWQRIRTIWQRK